MKYSLLFLLLIVLFSSCTQNKPELSDKTALELNNEEEQRFDWLIGNWLRTNEDTDKVTYEKWVLITPFHYAGEGYTLDESSGDTVSAEKMHLMYKDEEWSLAVISPNEVGTDTTSFALTAFDSVSFRCYNLVNEFPKLLPIILKQTP